ncbi:antitoxin [Verrucomicrobiota bacterium]|nr:antitoxin [Verrucomicrobiota bacterium]
MKSTWQLQQAKNQLSLLVEDALTKGPQTITRHGKPAVVVVAATDFVPPRRKRKGIVELFAPLKGSGIDLTRVRDYPREVKL